METYFSKGDDDFATKITSMKNIKGKCSRRGKIQILSFPSYYLGLLV